MESVISRLYQASDYDLEATQRGIVYIDEIDKIARKGDNPSISRDVSGEGVQQGLLKLLEGTIANIAPEGGRKHPDQKFIKIDTRNILFICGGAFNGIEKLIARRLNNSSVGFLTQGKERIKDINLIEQIAPTDLKSFGLIPEIIGRMPMITFLQPLDREALKNILVKPKNALLKQYIKLMELEGITLDFDKKAIDLIVSKAVEFKLGARGLRTICEKLMLDVMFDAPSKNEKSITITSDMVVEKLADLDASKAGLIPLFSFKFQVFTNIIRLLAYLRRPLTFDQLNISKQLINALSDLGFDYPTPIQSQIFPVIMSGKDVVGIAQTGTGKTFAYLLPLLRQLKYSEQQQPRILILVPTRELVIQVTEEVGKLTAYMNVRTTGIYGGVNINTQKTAVFNGLDILVATPGRLLDLVLNGVLRLKSIQTLVIDEMDEMLTLGFRSQLTRIMDLLPAKRQNLLFSATNSVDIETLISTFFNHPEKIEIAPSGTPLLQIVQKGFFVPNFYTKINFLEYLLKDVKKFNKVLVFVSTKKYADMVYDLLKSKFIGQIDVMHANKSQNYRINAIKFFDEG